MKQKLLILKKKSVYIPLIMAVILVCWYFISKNGNKISDDVVTAKRGQILQEVTVSGTVKPIDDVDLAFEKSGRIRKINVSIGDEVYAGQILMSLENGVELSALEDAKAKLASKQAHYNDLKKGGSPEEINLKQTALTKEESNLAINYSEIPNIISDSFNKADNAIYRQVDTLFSNPLSQNPKLNFNSSDQETIDAEVGRYDAGLTLTAFEQLAEETLNVNSEKELELKMQKTKEFLLKMNNFLIKISGALNSATNITGATLTTNKDALNTARTNINTALTNIVGQINIIAEQKIAVQEAKDNLALTKAPATTEVLAGAEADARSASAGVNNVEALLAKTFIFAPFNGIVTKQNAKIGQIASANETLTAVSSSHFKIEAFMPEVDVAKITKGNLADVTLDAYGSGVIFKAAVKNVEPAETVINGVSTYKTEFEFQKSDEKIRSGMTANIIISSAKKENALSIPSRLVYEKNGKKYVKVIDNKGDISEKEIVTGLKGASGEIEILGGLSLNDKVVPAK